MISSVASWQMMKKKKKHQLLLLDTGLFAVAVQIRAHEFAENRARLIIVVIK